jgi:hypothetical protein
LVQYNGVENKQQFVEITEQASEIERTLKFEELVRND